MAKGRSRGVTFGVLNASVLRASSNGSILEQCILRMFKRAGSVRRTLGMVPGAPMCPSRVHDTAGATATSTRTESSPVLSAAR